VARFTPVEREEYVASKKEYWDYYSAMKTSFDKGRAEGRDERSTEIARNLKRMGLSIADIAKAGGTAQGLSEGLHRGPSRLRPEEGLPLYRRCHRGECRPATEVTGTEDPDSLSVNV